MPSYDINGQEMIAGEIYVIPDPQARLAGGGFVVISQGDGTLENDTKQRGIFWERQDAEAFRGVLLAAKLL